MLNKLADLVEERDELALFECLDVGKTITAALNDDMGRVQHQLRDAASGLDNLLLPSGVRGNDIGYQPRKPPRRGGCHCRLELPGDPGRQQSGPGISYGQ